MPFSQTGPRSNVDSRPFVAASQDLTVWNSSGTTNATGAITFTLPVGFFTTVYNACAAAIKDTVDPTKACFALVRSFTTGQVVVQVFESKSTVYALGGTAEGLELATAATTVAITVYGV